MEATIVTMRRLLIGYIIGLVVGLPLGLLTARWKVWQDTIGTLALGLADIAERPAGSRLRSYGSGKPKRRCSSS